MLWKTKNLFSYLNKKGTILFVFLFSFLGLAYPRVSSAAWVKNLAIDIAAFIPYWIGRLIFNLAIKITTICGKLVNWIVSPNFISYSYTSPANNPVIEVGLNVTQGLANMILVLVLIYIAIAIMLQLAGYETKKLLLSFIFVALLVNFTPVICGLIVDASNIVMNFFVKDLPADSFAKLITSKVEALPVPFGENTDYRDTLSALTQVVLLTSFLFVLSFILLIFAIIFLLRYIAIWLLVILSPIAFVFYILPITRQYFSQWWKQFINWCFIGATCGFFLYLALFMATRLETQPTEKIAAPGISGELTVFDGILPYYVAVAFLGIGLIFGLKTSAIGASSVIGAVKSRGRGAVRGTRKAAGRATGWVGKKAARGAGQYIEEKAKIKERIAPAVSRIEKTPIARWFMPEGLKKYAEYSPAIQKAQTRAKNYSSRTLSDDVFSGKAIGSQAVANIIEQMERGDSEDIFKGGRRKFGKDFTDEQLLKHKDFKKVLKRALQIARMGGAHNKILRRDPRLAALMTGEDWGGDYKDMSNEKAIKTAAREARGSHIANWEKEVVSKENYGLPVTESLMERGRDPFENVARNVKNGVETIQDSIDNLFSNYVDKVLSKTNSNLSNSVKKGDQKATKSAWKEYHKHFKSQHNGKEGYFVALGGQRFRDLGYREGRYVAFSEDKKESPDDKKSTSPGQAIMEGKKETSLPGKPRTGREGKRRKNVPRTGIEGKRRRK